MAKRITKKRESEKHVYPKYLLLVITLLICYLAFLTIKPFLNAIIGAVIIAYIVYPVYKYFLRNLKNKNLTALLVSVIIILLITVPMFFVAENISKEAYYTYITAKQRLATGEIIGKCENDKGTLCSFLESLNELLTNPQAKAVITSTIGKAIDFITAKASGIIFSIPKLTLNLLIVLITIFYLFKEGESILERTKKTIPLKLYHQEQIYKQFGNIMYAMFYGTLVIALAEGIIGGVGFYIFGVPNALLWGIVMAILAMLPVVGASIIWIPASVILIVSGYLAGNPGMIWQGIALFAYCTILVSGTEFIIKPKVIGDRAKIHPLIILIGVLGGLVMFGIIGFILGPLILVFAKTAFEIYEKERLHV